VLDASGRSRLRNELPYPIAVNYKRIGACVSDSLPKLTYVLRTAEMVARLLAIIALADMRRCFEGRRLPLEAGVRVEFRQRLAAPTFGQWMRFLREAVLAIRESGRRPFVEELETFCFQKGDRPTEEIRILDRLIERRNDMFHGRLNLGDRTVAAECAENIPALEHVLWRLLFLGEYRLAFVWPIEVEKRRNTDPKYHRTTLVLAGCAEPFDAERDVSRVLCESGEVLLLGRDRETYLTLDPFIVYSDEGFEDREDLAGRKVTVTTGIHDVFLYDGERAGRLRYVACNRGGVLSSDRSAAGEYLEKGLTEFVAMFEDGKAPD